MIAHAAQVHGVGGSGTGVGVLPAVEPLEVRWTATRAGRVETLTIRVRPAAAGAVVSTRWSTLDGGPAEGESCASGEGWTSAAVQLDDQGLWHIDAPGVLRMSFRVHETPEGHDADKRPSRGSGGAGGADEAPTRGPLGRLELLFAATPEFGRAGVFGGSIERPEADWAVPQDDHGEPSGHVRQDSPHKGGPEQGIAPAR